MAYAGKMTSDISPRAKQWYEAVRDHVLMYREGGQRAMKLETLFKRMEAPILSGLYARSFLPQVSSDYFNWAVARAAWRQIEKQRPFPFEGDKPPLFGTPCSEQYVRHWYMQTKVDMHISGPRRTVSSSPEISTVHDRQILANRPRPDAECEPLSFPIPLIRQPELCLGPRGEIEKTVADAASILGPEFTLSCSYGGNQPHVVTMGLAPGVDLNDERVRSRARDPIDWLEEWWANVMEQDTNLLAFLELRIRQRLSRPHVDISARIAEAKKRIVYLEEKGETMAQSDVTKAVQAQQKRLESHALGLISQAVGTLSGWELRGEEIASFIENGHPEVFVLDRDDRMRVAQVLIRHNAMAFVDALICATVNAEGRLRRLDQSLDSFIEFGARSEPYITSLVERIGVVDEVVCQTSNIGTYEKLKVREMVMKWEQRIAEHLPLPLQAGSVATAATSRTASTIRPGPPRTSRSSGSGSSTRTVVPPAHGTSTRASPSDASTRAPSLAPSRVSRSTPSVAASRVSSGGASSEDDELMRRFGDLFVDRRTRGGRTGTHTSPPASMRSIRDYGSVSSDAGSSRANVNNYFGHADLGDPIPSLPESGW